MLFSSVRVKVRVRPFSHSRQMQKWTRPHFGASLIVLKYLGFEVSWVQSCFHTGMTNYRIGSHRTTSDHTELHRTMSDHVCKWEIIISKSKPKSAGISLRTNKPPGAHCNSSCSLDRSILYGTILNATLRTAGRRRSIFLKSVWNVAPPEPVTWPR